MKRAVILFTCLSFGVAQAETLNASVQQVYTVDTARVAAFSQAKPYTDMSGESPVDPNLLENKMALTKGLSTYEDRMITSFSTGGYSVTTLCSLTSRYYKANGRLVGVEYASSPQYYDDSCNVDNPSRIYKHIYPSGKLIGVALTVSDKEGYTFHPDGSLNTHWVGDRCFYSDGSSCGTRQTMTTK